MIVTANGNFSNEAEKQAFLSAIPAATPVAETLADVKRKQCALINAHCEAAIVAGFTSSALGAPYFYTCTRDDQLNLGNLVIAGTDDNFTCVDAAGVKARRMHTLAQLKAVHADGKAHIVPRMDKARALKDQIEAVLPSSPTALADVAAIVWVFP